MHFGATLRLLRTDAGVSLRSLAERIGVSSAYLSRVENGHDAPPTPDRLVAIARELDVPPAVLVELSDKVNPFVAGYLARVPAASTLFFEIAHRELTTAQIARVQAFVDETFPLPRGARSTVDGAPRAPRLATLLTGAGVVTQLACTDLDDVLDVAATRLAGPSGASAATIAKALRDRERDSPTLVGAGLALPHAVIAGAKTAATLVTLRRPLAVEEAPDGKPLRVCVVLVAPNARKELLALLAHVARLARDDFADELCAARDARRVTAILEAMQA